MKTQLLRGYEVRTCVELPLKYGEVDHDNARYCAFHVETKRKAKELARHLLPKDKWGGVEITEFRLEYYDEACPAAGMHRVYTSDPEYIEA